MKAAVMRGVSPDLVGPLLRIEDVPDPEITEPDQVVVRVAAAGVCRTDLHVLTGEMEAPLPHILGHENAGYVHRTGEAVTSVREGEAVICYPFQSDGLSRAERRGTDSRAPHRITPGLDAPGGYAEYLLCRERSLLPLPAGTDPTAYAPLTDAGLAAYRACARPDLRPGDAAVVIGAGGLGHLAVQILKAVSPARVVAVDPRPSARELALECGADAAATPGEAAGALPDGGAAAVLDFVGSDDTIAAGLGMLRSGGHFLAVGVGGSLTLSAADLITSEYRIEGIYVGSYPELLEVTALAQAGRVVPRIVAYPLAEADRALTDLANGEITGRAVLIP